MANVTKKIGSANADIYSVVTEKFIDALKGGVIPWRRPWSGKVTEARSYESGAPYSFLNQCLIYSQAEQLNAGIEDQETRRARVKKITAGRFITFTALQKIDGARIIKGSKSYLVTFYKPFQPIDKATGKPAVIIAEDGTERPKLIPLLKYYRVFSEFDCSGLPEQAPEEVKVLDPIAEADKVINNYVGKANGGPEFFVENSNRAYYSPSADQVHVPGLDQYTQVAEYYSTTFHELTHSTGISTRCNREGFGGVVHFGDKDYSREELVAEMGAAMCLHRLQISTDGAFKNSVAYVQSWLRALQNDNKMVIWAAGRAEKAVKWIFGERGEKTTAPEPEEPKSEPQPTTEPEPVQAPIIDITEPAKDKIIRLHISILKAQKIGGVISEVVQEEWVYLNGHKLTKDINQATKVTAEFAESEREYVVETTKKAIQAKLDSKYPGKYSVEVIFSTL